MTPNSSYAGQQAEAPLSRRTSCSGDGEILSLPGPTGGQLLPPNADTSPFRGTLLPRGRLDRRPPRGRRPGQRQTTLYASIDRVARRSHCGRKNALPSTPVTPLGVRRNGGSGRGPPAQGGQERADGATNILHRSAIRPRPLPPSFWGDAM